VGTSQVVASSAFELPLSGLNAHYGSHELIASNYVDVLDILSFAGKADVFHWLKEGDNLNHKLYWRQTLNRPTHALSVNAQLSSFRVCCRMHEAIRSTNKHLIQSNQNNDRGVAILAYRE
jgi:hypothetical protein